VIITKKNSAGREGERKKAEVDGGRRGRPRTLGVHTYIHYIILYICTVAMYTGGERMQLRVASRRALHPPARPIRRLVTSQSKNASGEIHTYTHALAHRFTNTHAHTHTLSETHTHTYTYTHRLTHTDLQTHTRARAHMHIHAHDGSLARGAVIYYATVRRARVPSSPSPSSPSCGRVEKPRAPSRQLLIRARERECNALVDDDDDDDDDCIKLHSAS